MFKKKRRFWNRIGEFVEYVFGSVVVRIFGDPIVIGRQKGNDGKMHDILTNEIELPIQYTTLIAKNKNEIPEYYRNNYVF
jgi:hypothetical protein